MESANRTNSVDPGLRRFDILRICTINMNLHKDVNLMEITKETDGYVGEDLTSLCSKIVLSQIREKTML